MESCAIGAINAPCQLQAPNSKTFELRNIYGGKTTDLVGNMLHQIRTFDIYPFEKRNLKFTIVANHFKTMRSILHRLVEDGFMLSQIRFMHNGQAQYASPVHDYMEDETMVDWVMDRRSGTVVRSCSSDMDSIGESIKPLLGVK